MPALGGDYIAVDESDLAFLADRVSAGLLPPPGDLRDIYVGGRPADRDDRGDDAEFLDRLAIRPLEDERRADIREAHEDVRTHRADHDTLGDRHKSLARLLS